MRISKDILNIDYCDTQNFFQNRTEKYNADNPYTVTMYQDNNPQLAEKRNLAEVNKLIPKLNLNNNSKVLDLACGVGRWADAINVDVAEYCGIDFIEDFINIAKSRNKKENFSFYCGSVGNVRKILNDLGKGMYNTILMMGIFVYLNDDELTSTLSQTKEICDKHTIICIRGPVAINDRLTLKNDYSVELGVNYNAIYRNREEMLSFLQIFTDAGFEIVEENFLFDEKSLNNRKETSQYYYILKR
ncbi:MAG: class I SAM-dependent methyltransferase [Clostridium sp.]|nr:class I SAM-dependent methyltransferase [Clostridium sp.]MCM1207419.1 class I SAM-dependent methyltransferase [Ruminococcus sp.]